MKRIAAIGPLLLALVTSSGAALAQPKRPAEAPIDPYAEPPKPAKPDPKPEPKADPLAREASRDTSPSKIPPRVGLTDVTAVQGLLAVQRLDGWLLFDRDGSNPIARRVVAPEGHPTRPWFYLIPAKGEPIALVHDAEKRS